MDVTGLIGNTPLVQIPLRPSAEGPRLWAKAEFLQPGGSVKDRAAKAIIRRARRLGDLRPGQRVVEMSSGNMAAGLAVICNALGHPLSIFMSRGNSPERIAQLTAFGVDLHLVEQVSGTLAHVTGDDIAAAAQAAAVHAQRTGSYYVDQFNNPGSVEAHAHGTGPEILQALNGRVDAFLSVVGSGGTFVGVASAFAAAGVTPRRIAVEPVGAAVLAGKPVTAAGHLLQGTGYGFVPPHWQDNLVDAYQTVTDEQAVRWRRRLATDHGLYVGYSSAANVAAAADLAASGDLPTTANIVTILCDTGLKYAPDPTTEAATCQPPSSQPAPRSRQ